MATVIPKPEDEPREPADVRLFLPDAEKTAQGLTDIGIGKEVELRITGTVKSYRSEYYMHGASISVEPRAVEIRTADQTITLDDALKAATTKA